MDVIMTALAPLCVCVCSVLLTRWIHMQPGGGSQLCVCANCPAMGMLFVMRERERERDVLFVR